MGIVILDFKNNFGNLVKGLLKSSKFESELFNSKRKSNLAIKHHLKKANVVFVGEAPKKAMDYLSEQDNLKIVKIGKVKEGNEGRYDEIIPRPINLTVFGRILRSLGLTKKMILKPVKRSRKDFSNLVDTCNLILHAINDGNSTKKEILGSIEKDITNPSWAKAIKALVESKQVVREGKKRGAKYHVPKVKKSKKRNTIKRKGSRG